MTMVLDWSTALTLVDLGRCTAAMLERRLGGMPGHALYPAIHPEIQPLLPYLVPVNRSGNFVTVASQPGSLPNDRPRRGMHDTQRAAVQGFVPESMLRRVFALSQKREWLYVRCRKPHRGSEDFRYPVSMHQGRVVTYFGHIMGTDELMQRYGGGRLHPDVLPPLLSAWQLLLADEEWGNNDRLWPLLRELQRR